jgi:hypothetical protein
MSKGTSWIMFFVATIVCLLMLVFLPQIFWIPLPFVITGLAQGLDAI